LIQPGSAVACCCFCLSYNTFLAHPFQVIAAGSSKDLSVLGLEAKVASCGPLNLLKQVDVFAFGFERDVLVDPAISKYNSTGICVAANPCEHTYAIGQRGILPPIQFPPDLKITVDSIAFSLQKKLVARTYNKMWSGGPTDAQIDIAGHIALTGTGVISRDVSFGKVKIEIKARLVVDADYNNNGVISPIQDNAASVSSMYCTRKHLKMSVALNPVTFCLPHEISGC
jgi:hypothetical protein